MRYRAKYPERESTRACGFSSWLFLLAGGNYGGFRRQSRNIEFDFAGAIVAGILGRLLIFDFAIDDVLEVRPLDGLRDAAAVHKDGGGSVHIERAAFGDLLFDLGRGGLGVDAPAEFQDIDILGVFGPTRHLILEVLRGDGFLMRENPVVIFPEGFGLLLEDAASGDGAALRP